MSEESHIVITPPDAPSHSMRPPAIPTTPVFEGDPADAGESGEQPAAPSAESASDDGLTPTTIEVARDPSTGQFRSKKEREVAEAADAERASRAADVERAEAHAFIKVMRERGEEDRIPADLIRKYGDPAKQPTAKPQAKQEDKQEPAATARHESQVAMAKDPAARERLSRARQALLRDGIFTIEELDGWSADTLLAKGEKRATMQAQVDAAQRKNKGDDDDADAADPAGDRPDTGQPSVNEVLERAREILSESDARALDQIIRGHEAVAQQALVDAQLIVSHRDLCDQWPQLRDADVFQAVRTQMDALDPKGSRLGDVHGLMVEACEKVIGKPAAAARSKQNSQPADPAQRDRFHKAVGSNLTVVPDQRKTSGARMTMAEHNERVEQLSFHAVTKLGMTGQQAAAWVKQQMASAAAGGT